MKTVDMMNTYLEATDLDRDLLARTIDALTQCAQTCTACADACLDEQMVADLRQCIHANLDCADICATTARVLSRHAGYNPDVTRAQLQACIQACRSCADACEQHAGHHEHCRLCAEVCRACEQACTEFLAAIA